MRKNLGKNIYYYLLSLGCPKNLVDSENIQGLLGKNGFKLCENIEEARILLLNTCAFIKAAKEESIEMILEMGRIKKEDPNKKIIVIGCLVQRYLPELFKELPEVDLWITFKDIPKIPELTRSLLLEEEITAYSLSPAPSHFLADINSPRELITPSHYAYIKIAEGCSNRCSYCIIPDIKGDFQSRNLESILNEARKLTGQGVKELNLIAQDTTNYGKDLAKETDIVHLLNRLCSIDDTKWIRLLYTHPAKITDRLIKEIKNHEKICNYIDLPLQHTDNDILNKMGRKVTSEYVKDLIKRIRDQIPNVIIRTAFIVGFPGETEKQFANLLKYMEKIQFDRLGIFAYSREEGTKAYSFKNRVPEKVKEQRFHKAMQLQNEIAQEVNKQFNGKIMEVLIEKRDEQAPDTWLGRTYADAPEVDGLVYVKQNKTDKINPGDLINVKITDTLEYDLVGDVIPE